MKSYLIFINYFNYYYYLINYRWMFSGCSDDLKRKIKSENKNIKDEAFTDYE